MEVPPEESNFDDHIKDLEKDPVFLRKRKATLFCFFIRMFLIGTEYVIILPSVWLYLKRFKVEPWFLGIVVAIYPTAAVFSLLAAGRMYDKTKQTRKILLFLNVFEILGNIVYALPFSKWLIVSGRLIAGLGDGFFACAASEIAHTYPIANRTGALALLELGRVLGLIIAPGLNFLMVKVDFAIGEWVIDKGSVPGVIMAILWMLSQILCFFHISNLSLMIKERVMCYQTMELNSMEDTPNVYGTIVNERITENSLCDSIEGDVVSDKKPLTTNNNVNIKHYQSTIGTTFIQNNSAEKSEAIDPDTRVARAEVPTKDKGVIRQIFELLTTVEVAAIFYTDLILRMVQVEFEVFIPLITQERYGWGETETSCVYIVGGVLLMVLFLLIYKCSAKSKIKDQHYIVVSLVLTTFALSILLIELFVPKQYRVSMFVIFCIFIFSALPLNLVACKSLVTKITPRASQGVTQAVYLSIIRTSFIVGPILAGAAFSHRLEFSCVMIALCVIAFVLMVLLLRRIQDKIKTTQSLEGW